MMEILLLSLCFAAATWVSGWFQLVLIAMLWMAWRRQAPWKAGVAGAIGWAGLLLTIPMAPLGRLAPRLGGVIGVPGWAMLLLPPLFAFLLAWSAGTVTKSILPQRHRDTELL